MTTVTARALSGVHLGAHVTFDGLLDEHVTGLLRQIEHMEGLPATRLAIDTGTYLIRNIHPDTPITIKDTP